MQQNQRDSEKITEFACYIRNFTPVPVRLAVPLGEMGRLPKLTDTEFDALLELNRDRYSATGAGVRGGARVGEASLEKVRSVLRPDLL